MSDTSERRPTSPRVSVVTCFHNRRDYVTQSVSSVLDQTYDDYEVILVDDASTDGTGDLLAGITDPKVRVVRNTSNQGFVRSLVSAIALARGELIAIHGAGDVSYQRRLERQVAFLDANPKHLAVGCHRDVLTPGGQVVSRTTPGPEITRSDLLTGNVYSHGEVMFRRSAYLDAGGYRLDMKYAQDYDLWLRLVTLGKLGVVQEVLYGRVAHEDGVSFDPAKLAQQAAFSELARSMAAGEVQDTAATMNKVATFGVHAVIPVSNARVAAKLRKRVKVLIGLGRWDAAHHLAFDVLEPGWAHQLETTLVRFVCVIGKVLDPNGTLARKLLAGWRA